MEERRVIVGDREQPQLSETLPIVLVLDQLRSAFNVGNIFRLAEATRVREIITCGYTASPPHPKLASTARGCDELVRSRRMETAAEAIDWLHQEGYTVYGVETVAGASNIWSFQPQFPAAFMFGNEALGLSDEALRLCDAFVALPVFGKKNSINVGNCAAVTLYAAIHYALKDLQQECLPTP